MDPTQVRPQRLFEKIVVRAAIVAWRNNRVWSIHIHKSLPLVHPMACLHGEGHLWVYMPKKKPCRVNATHCRRWLPRNHWSVAPDMHALRLSGSYNEVAINAGPT